MSFTSRSSPGLQLDGPRTYYQVVRVTLGEPSSGAGAEGGAGVKVELEVEQGLTVFYRSS